MNQASILNLNSNMVALGKVTQTMQRQAMKRLTIEETGYGDSEGNDSERWSEDDNATKQISGTIK